MAKKQTPAGLSGELAEAFDELQNALERAEHAAASLRELLPRIGAIGSVFEEIEAVIESGRRQIGADQPAPGSAYARPTLVVPAQRIQRPPQPWSPDDGHIPALNGDHTESDSFSSGETGAGAMPLAAGASNEGLTCFRLEFDSQPGPLDLRTVDDAVSEHPAVRDVALLDYDGRHATLKVWIEPSATPAQIQQALIDRAPDLFDVSNSVTIVALEDVA